MRMNVFRRLIMFWTRVNHMKSPISKIVKYILVMTEKRVMQFVIQIWYAFCYSFVLVSSTQKLHLATLRNAGRICIFIGFS